ncbi:MAG TPA: MmgE/PrpD family protein, partial [Afifellaceae bacterium]|nr:MmgE/PrpD family protein [Afifellaceae bacterium]
TEMDDPTSMIAAYIAEAAGRPLPEAVADKARLHLLDGLAAILSGSRLKPGRMGAAFVESLGGREEATVLGTPLLTSSVNAALANGMSGHADETDDSHAAGRFHPGCAILPAALAMAERQGRSGTELLRAMVLGYDIGARFTLALGFSAPRSGTHSTHSTGTIFGATAAAGSLAGLTAEQCAWAIAYAVQQASGVPIWHRDPEHVEKSFDFGGMGARNGVTAALMAAAGMSGVADPLTGPHGYIEAFAEKADPAALTDGLGDRYEIMRASIKKWTTGMPIQAALDSLTVLMAEHGLRADDVARLTAILPDDRLAIVDNGRMPDVCLQHLLAVTLVDGGLTFKSSHDEARMHDPEVLEVRSRVAAVPSAELTTARPERQAIIEIETRDGRRLAHRTRAVRGTPDNPMTQDEVAAKARDLLVPVIGGRADALIETAFAIEAIDDLRELRPLLRG